jgi:CRISPR-associated protein Cmr1
MQTSELSVRLNTPAFLGDADQKGVWRTPPLKALMREWWRIAAAPAADYRHQKLREQEGVLFGNAWLEPLADKKSRFCQSQVRLALAHWRTGTLTQHVPAPKVDHPEVPEDKKTKTKQVEPLGYLGYGPVYKGSLKANAALQADEAGKYSNALKLAWPDQETAIPQVLQLIHWFGSIGGRSRNGWGSLEFAGQKALAKHDETLQTVLRPLGDCLQLDWPHAIGQDKQGALIWESSKSFKDWKEAMQFLARTKIGFRTQKPLEFGKAPTPHKYPLARHILAYPVTNHKVTASEWGGDGRLANQLRFKLFRDSQQKLRARIYHTPHACPLRGVMLDQQAVWQKIHHWLDQNTDLQRLGDAQ